MSIIHSYHEGGKPIISIEEQYEKNAVTFDACIATFSKRVIDVLLENNLVELISEDAIRSISCNYPVYRFLGTNIGIFKTTVGAPIASVLIAEVAYVFSCDKFVLYGSCGSLNKNIPKNKLIVPTHAYRDEGTSYHYMPPTDYIEIKNYQKVREILDRMNIEYVLGKTWTTDAFYRETQEEMQERKNEGCIAVEMEISACQAVCNYYNINLYCFLYRADNLDASAWEKGQRDKLLTKDERLKVLSVAFEIASSIRD